MTEPREVTVSDEEAREFMRAHKDAVTKGNPGPLPPHMRPDPDAVERRSIEYTRQALAAFLARRVPDAITFDPHDECTHQSWKDKFHGANKFRDKVLKGV